MTLAAKKNWQWGLLLTSSLCLVNVQVSHAANILVQPSPFKGLNGLNFDPTDQLYVTSVAEQTIYRVNANTGQFETFIVPHRISPRF